MRHGLGIGAGGDQPTGLTQTPGPGPAQTPGLGPNQPDARGVPGEEQASDEEQAIYQRVIELFMLALYDDKMQSKTVEFIKAAPDPVEGVAEVASLIAMRVYTKAQEGGLDIPGDVMLFAGKDAMVPLVIELAEAAGVADFTQEQIDAAFFAASDKFTSAVREMGGYTDDVRDDDRKALDEMADSGEIEALLQRMGPDQGQEPAP